jgi:hypothetical protein
MSLRLCYAPASGRMVGLGFDFTQALFLSAQARLGNDLGYIIPGLRPFTLCVG